MSHDLYPTPTRLRLLADVTRHRVYRHPDGTSHVAGGRQATAAIATLAAAGWVEIDPATDVSDYQVAYWRLTDTGREVLSHHGGELHGA
ncbi:MAG UNVERIFIED_CONTAM: hypothetical protein LOD86_00035 [Thermobifida fusca]